MYYGRNVSIKFKFNFWACFPGERVIKSTDFAGKVVILCLKEVFGVGAFRKNVKRGKLRGWENQQTMIVCNYYHCENKTHNNNKGNLCKP